MWGNLKSLAEKIKCEVAVYRLVLQDPGTPRLARWLLGLAVAYLASPIDVIPDFIPILGQLDDALIVPTLIFLAVRLIPPEVMEKCRQRAGASKTPPS